MKKHLFIILILLFSGSLGSFGQTGKSSNSFTLKGSVVAKETLVPISGISVSTNNGAYTTTNGLGEFQLKVAVGEELIFEDSRIETVRHVIKSKDDIQIQVEGYSPSKQRRESSGISSTAASLHQSFLDSAEYYKKNDLAKSIDFIARSIEQLGDRGNKKELARSLTALGEVYLNYNQYDLAIDNFEDALEANKTIATTLLLGKTYITAKEFGKALDVLRPMVDMKNMVPYQRVTLFETLGDANKGEGEIKSCLGFLQRGPKSGHKESDYP